MTNDPSKYPSKFPTSNPTIVTVSPSTNPTETISPSNQPTINTNAPSDTSLGPSLSPTPQTNTPSKHPVEFNEPVSSGSSKSLDIGVVIGIVVGCVVLLVCGFIIFFFWWKNRVLTQSRDLVAQQSQGDVLEGIDVDGTEPVYFTQPTSNIHNMTVTTPNGLTPR